MKTGFVQREPNWFWHFLWRLCFVGCFLIISGAIFAQPRVLSFSPANGVEGTVVTISGSGFDATAASNIVFFNNAAATVLSSTPNEIKAVVPKGAIYGPITVSVGGRSGSSKSDFTPSVVGGTGTSISDSTFDLASSTVVSSMPTWLAAADFDGDTKADVAVTYRNPGKLEVFKNTSSGSNISFASVLSYDLAGEVFVVEIVDFDSDGKNDIMVTISEAHSVLLFKNSSQSGGLSFTLVATIDVGQNPFDICAADFNNDGQTDLAVANGSSPFITILTNQTVGGVVSFAKSSVNAGTGQATLTAADFNNDGRIDIVAGSISQNGGIRILRNTSSGSVLSFVAGSPISLLPSFYESVSVDYNNDGWTDVVLNTAGGLLLLENRRVSNTILFQTRSVNGSSNLSVMLKAELNYDGFPEIVSVSSVAGPFISINNLRNDSKFIKTTNITTTTAALADFDHDGRCDLVVGTTWPSLDVYVSKKQPLAEIIDFNPKVATLAKRVDITGNNLDLITKVSFGAVQADSFGLVNSGTIKAYPGNGASGDVSLSAGMLNFSKPGFAYIQPPVITKISTDTVVYNSRIVIFGKHFSTASSVVFGTIPARSFVVLSDSTIEAIVDSANGNEVGIETFAGRSSIGGLTFIGRPFISGYSINVLPNDTLEVYGNGFIGVSNISVGGVSFSNFTVAGNHTIAIKLPSFYLGGKIKVVARGGADSAYGFYNGFDSVSCTPNKGSAGDVVDIAIWSKHPLQLDGIPHVYFNDTRAKVIAVSNQKLKVVVPHGIPLANIRVSLNGCSRSATIPFINTQPVADSDITEKTFDSFVSIDKDSITTHTQLLITDVDYDQQADFVLLYTGYSNGLVIYRNISTPGVPKFVKSVFSPPNGTSAQLQKPILTDLDNDGKQELIITDINGEVGYYENTSTPGAVSLSWKGRLPLAPMMGPFQHADIDGDGRTDLLSYVIPSNPHLGIFLNTSLPGKISFANAVSITNDENYRQVGGREIELADLNRDGKPDLAINEYAAGIFINNSVPGFVYFTAGHSLTKNMYSSIELFDCNGDGFIDIGCNASYSLGNGVQGSRLTYDVHQNRGSVNQPFFEHPVNTTNGYAILTLQGHVADFNGDAKIDVVGVGLFDKSFRILQNTSTTANVGFNEIKGYIGSTAPTLSESMVDAADVDNDGRIDVIEWSKNGSSLHIFRNTGTMPTINNLCAGDSVVLTAEKDASLYYQWQVSVEGGGFNNMIDNAGYRGTRTRQLTIYGQAANDTSLYRCVVDDIAGKATGISFVNTFLGSEDARWSNPLNWSCKSLPTERTHVLVAAPIIVDINATIKKITVLPGISLSMGPGVSLSIKP